MKRFAPHVRKVARDSDGGRQCYLQLLEQIGARRGV